LKKVSSLDSLYNSEIGAGELTQVAIDNQKIPLKGYKYLVEIAGLFAATVR
jgi:hypothetical protein